MDQFSGRVGDPPGLSLGSGSSQLPEVKVLQKIYNVDEALFPPMNHEELELLVSMMLDGGKVLTGQSDLRDQRDQQEKGEQLSQHPLQLPQDQDTTSQHQLKWDLATGRAGDPLA